MNIGAFTLSPSMLMVNGYEDIEKWEASARIVFGMQRSVNWWIGDMFVYGEQRFGDDIYQIADHTVSEDLVGRCIAVSREFPPTERHMTLSWTHHQAVMGLAKPLQKAMLNKAEENGWDTATFREQIGRMKQVMK